jgi:CBS domain-containing protein
MKKYSINAFMSPTPLTVESTLSLREAKWFLRNRGVRHLPVTEGGKLVGVLSERDIKTAHVYLGDECENHPTSIAMTPHPYCVTPDADLADVVAEMARQKYGCAVVIDRAGKVMGIFTTVDALTVLAQALRGETDKWQPSAPADATFRHLRVEP